MKIMVWTVAVLLCVSGLGCEAMMSSMRRNAELEKAQEDRTQARLAEQDGYEAINPDRLEPATAGRKVKFCTDRPDLESKSSYMPGPDDKERQSAAAGWVGSNQAPAGRRFIVLRYTMEGGGGGEEIWTSVPEADGAAFRAATSSGEPYCLWLDGQMDRLPVFKTRQVYHFPASSWKDHSWLDSAPAGGGSAGSPSTGDACAGGVQTPDCMIANMRAQQQSLMDVRSTNCPPPGTPLPFSQAVNPAFAADYAGCSVRVEARLVRGSSRWSNVNIDTFDGMGQLSPDAFVFDVDDPNQPSDPAAGAETPVRAPKTAGSVVFGLKAGDIVVLTGAPRKGPMPVGRFVFVATQVERKPE